jgi:hypothetical protein
VGSGTTGRRSVSAIGASTLLATWLRRSGVPSPSGPAAALSTRATTRPVSRAKAATPRARHSSSVTRLASRGSAQIWATSRTHVTRESLLKLSVRLRQFRGVPVLDVAASACQHPPHLQSASGYGGESRQAEDFWTDEDSDPSRRSSRRSARSSGRRSRGGEQRRVVLLRDTSVCPTKRLPDRADSGRRGEELCPSRTGTCAPAGVLERVTPLAGGDRGDPRTGAFLLLTKSSLEPARKPPGRVGQCTAGIETRSCRSADSKTARRGGHGALGGWPWKLVPFAGIDLRFGRIVRLDGSSRLRACMRPSGKGRCARRWAELAVRGTRPLPADARPAAANRDRVPAGRRPCRHPGPRAPAQILRTMTSVAVETSPNGSWRRYRGAADRRPSQAAAISPPASCLDEQPAQHRSTS